MFHRFTSSLPASFVLRRLTFEVRDTRRRRSCCRSEQMCPAVVCPLDRRVRTGPTKAPLRRAPWVATVLREPTRVRHAWAARRTIVAILRPTPGCVARTFLACFNEGTAVEHTPPFGLCVPLEPTRWCAGRQRTDSPRRCGKKPSHDEPVRRPPTDGRPTPTQRACCSTRRSN